MRAKGCRGAACDAAGAEIVIGGREGKESGDAQKASAAEALAGKLESVLNGTNHQWYLNRMDPAEKERREKQMQEFRQRYGQ